MVDRRAPKARQHQLGRDRLYILPSAGGFAFCGLIAILWMLGTNYQNNLILGLCLLLASLFVLSILRTHSNLAGLDIRIRAAREAFAGGTLIVEFEVSNSTSRDKDSISLAWQGGAPVLFALDGLQRKTVSVALRARQRGWLTPPRLLVSTVYPLGLLRCWTRLNFDTRALIYPRPLAKRPLRLQAAAGSEESGEPVSGGEDFAGVRAYRSGDSLRHIAWKHYAKGKGLVTKEFGSGTSADVWLSWFALDGLGTEQRLGVLCQWVLECEKLNQAYGLQLPAFTLEPGQGSAHRRNALQALALHRDEGGQ